MEEKKPIIYLEIRHKKQKNIIQLLLLILCTLLLYASAILPLQKLTLPGNTPNGIVGDLCEIFYVLVGYSDYVYIIFRTFAAIGAVLMTAWTIQQVKVSSVKGALLTIGEEGITDNVSPYRVGFIPWSDIHDIQTKVRKSASGKRSYIEVTVKSGADYLQTMRKKAGAKKLVLTGAGMLDIPIFLREVDADTVQIAVYMRKMLNEHRKSIIQL